MQTLSTEPAVAPEVRTLSSTLQPGGNQLLSPGAARFRVCSVPFDIPIRTLSLPLNQLLLRFLPWIRDSCSSPMRFADFVGSDFEEGSLWCFKIGVWFFLFPTGFNSVLGKPKLNFKFENLRTGYHDHICIHRIQTKFRLTV